MKTKEEVEALLKNVLQTSALLKKKEHALKEEEDRLKEEAAHLASLFKTVTERERVVQYNELRIKKRLSELGTKRGM